MVTLIRRSVCAGSMEALCSILISFDPGFKIIGNYLGEIVDFGDLASLYAF